MISSRYIERDHFAMCFVILCSSLCFLWAAYVSVKHDPDSESEIVLCAVKQPRRVVIDLDRSDGSAIACANVYTASKRGRKSGLAKRGICRTRTREHCRAHVGVDIEAIASMRDANECMSEWLKPSLRRVVFYLYTSQKVEHARFDVDVCVRRPEGRKIKIPGLEVSRKITLDTEIAREVSRRRDFE